MGSNIGGVVPLEQSIEPFAGERVKTGFSAKTYGRYYPEIGIRGVTNKGYGPTTRACVRSLIVRFGITIPAHQASP